MASWLLGPGIAVAIDGPAGSCSKNGASLAGSSYCIAAAAVACLGVDADASDLTATCRGTVILVRGLSRAVLLKRDAIAVPVLVAVRRDSGCKMADLEVKPPDWHTLV